MRTNIKGFIAKVLVLCMVFTMLPTMALVASATGPNDPYYTVKVDATPSHGTVSIYYNISDDTYQYVTLDTNSTYGVTPDTEVKVKLTRIITTALTRVLTIRSAQILIHIIRSRITMAMWEPMLK